tara:strand:+ start:1318 stop:1599 length:282 start_codon:yes stop_codon:yes gene_type:complete
MELFHIINGTKVLFTAEEEAEWNAVNAAAAANADNVAAAQVREERDVLLAVCDWRASSDVTMSDAWRTYRAALRDVPAQAGFPNSITWPSEPS